MPKLTSRLELTAASVEDLVHVVDVSDTTSGTGGTSKKITLGNIAKGVGLDLRGVADVKLKGHHLTVKVIGHEYESIIPGTPWDAVDGGNGTVYMPKMGPLEKRVITHGNTGDKSGLVDGTWTVPVDGAAPLVIDDFTHILETSSYRYVVQPADTFMLHRIYYRLANTLAEIQAHTGVRVRFYYGNIQLSALEADETAGTGLYDAIKFIDVNKTPSELSAEGISIFTQRGELFFTLFENDYPEGQVMTGWIKTLDVDETFKIYTNQDETSPWRAIDKVTETHIALAPVSLMFPGVSITAPVADSVAQSLTPTLTVVKGTPRAGEQLDFSLLETRFQVFNKESQHSVLDKTVSGSTYTMAAGEKLSGATQYQVRATPITYDDIPLQRTGMLTFTTALETTININTSVTRNGVVLTLIAGDLIELNVGESLNSVGYNFHVSGQAIEFPPVAYDSGGFRFRDTLGAELNFMVYAVTGTTPNRTAQCFIEVTAKVIADAQLVLTEVA